MADLIITGKYLLSLDDDHTVHKDAAVVIRGDRIVEIGKAAEMISGYPDAQVIREEHGLIMPGLINTHTHAAMSCFRGLADDLPLMEWLQQHIFPAEAKLTGEMVYRATLLSICEMIRSGTTTFCDMYLFAADVARAAALSGMRAWIGEVLYDFPSPNYGGVENGFAYTRELFAAYEGHETITITVDPHAVYTCSPDLLVKLGDLAASQDALYVIHLSENQDEVDTCRQRYGRSPVRHLAELGLLGERVVADHCVVVDEGEIVLLAEHGVGVAHCAESNMKLASGVAPVVEMLAAGIAVGIGTDGSASNNDVDMFGEMNSVAKLQKVHRLDPTAMSAADTLWAATRGGAAVLGAGEEIGSLTPGKKADLIVIDLAQPHLTPIYNPVSHLVYAARGGDVIHSVINGRVVMRNRRLTQLDEEEILSGAVEISRKIRGISKLG